MGLERLNDDAMTAPILVVTLLLASRYKWYSCMREVLVPPVECATPVDSEDLPIFVRCKGRHACRWS